MTAPTQNRHASVRWSWLAVPVLIGAMATVYATVAPSVFFDPPWIILIGNTLFVTVVSLVVSGFALKNYRATGRIQVLLLGCGVLLFGIGGALAAIVRGLPDGANLNVTIYNTGAFLGAAFHFAAAFLLLAGVSSEAGSERKGTWLVCGYAGSVLFMTLLTFASLKSLLPPFFIQGVGPTVLRQRILGSADMMFVFSFLIFAATYRRNGEVFLYWYACALALTAISLTAFFIQSSVGSPVGWVGRISQYVGGVYFLMSLFAAGQAAQQRRTSLDEVLTASLAGAEERFRSAFANAAIGFAVTTPDGRCVDVNAAYCAITGYRAEELRAMEFSRLIHPDDRAANMRQIARLLAGEIADFTLENRSLRKVGAPVWVRKSVSLVRDARGAPHWILAIIEDISERKRAEWALRESEARFRAVLDSARDVIYCFNQQTGGYEYISPSCEASVGFSAEELMALDSEASVAMIHPDDRPAMQAAAVRLGQTGTAELEYRQQAKGGGYRWLSNRMSLTRDGNGLPLHRNGSIRDITERKRAEETLRAQNAAALNLMKDAVAARNEAERSNSQLQQSEARFRLALRNAPVSIAAQDRDLRFTWAYNQRSVRPDEIIGHFDREIFTAEEAAHFTALKRRVLDEGIEHREQRWLDRPTGRMYLDIYWEPIRDDAGHIVGVASATVDLTPIKSAEEQIAAALHEKEVLLKEVHHRVKNNLQVISSLVSLQAEALADPALRAILDDVRDRVHSMALVHEKLYMSQNLAQVDLAEYVKSLLHQLWRGHRASAAVKLNLALESVVVPAETVVPCGLILNELASNALRHAFKDRVSGTVAVALARDAAAGAIRLAVSDDGVGMPPGFDWRNAKSLGLRLVQMLTQQMGGRVEAKPATGGGTAFSVTLGMPEVQGGA